MKATPVLLTRPGPRGEVLAAVVAAAGHAVERLDLVDLEPLALSPAARTALLDLDLFQGIIVISPQAATCLAEAIASYWPQLPRGMRFYAVGEATAQALHEELGVPAVLPGKGAGEHSEGLLQVASLRAVAGKRLLLARGETGREVLGETLTARGAEVVSLPLYRRRFLPLAEAASARLTAGNYAALVVSSGEILQHLITVCGSSALHQPLIVSSRRLATLAESLGFGSIHVASGASPTALSAAVDAALEARSATFDQGDHDKGKRR
ncbi:uroporphyrinogen-III synthase [Salinicola rhizosphaerae]|uniref:Uroporphyrinogen-III synthase n=1 Tax=Salinicola rhizosphaerae TaxID=1443141 RepID=A0ABQ3DRW8_9GAMM|nr:uroporphyrinogen-III synthase [Salinicola rhizosphaerae]GHB12293.1 uroporphyrinogen III methyltransferase [Salinicola rhizosphaerae]